MKTVEINTPLDMVLFNRIRSMHKIGTHWTLEHAILEKPNSMCFYATHLLKVNVETIEARYFEDYSLKEGKQSLLIPGGWDFLGETTPLQDHIFDIFDGAFRTERVIEIKREGDYFDFIFGKFRFLYAYYDLNEAKGMTGIDFSGMQKGDRVHFKYQIEETWK